MCNSFWLKCFLTNPQQIEHQIFTGLSNIQMSSNASCCDITTLTPSSIAPTPNLFFQGTRYGVNNKVHECFVFHIYLRYSILLAFVRHRQTFNGCSRTFFILGSVTRLGDLLDFGQLYKPLATINSAKSPTFLSNFCKGVKIYHFSSKIIFWQLL